MQQLILCIGYAMLWMMEPYWKDFSLSETFCLDQNMHFGSSKQMFLLQIDLSGILNSDTFSASTSIMNANFWKYAFQLQKHPVFLWEITLC
jgi:hypothetical protein